MALLPSSEQVFIAWAKTVAALNTITGGRVGTKLNATLPAIRVNRVGGTATEPWQDTPQLQVECWAVDQATADLLARTVISSLTGVRIPVAGGVIHSYSVSGGPFWSPDDPNLSQNARYILTIDLLITTPVGV